MESKKLRVGQWIEVRSKDEIQNTLDKKGQIDGMPFMPEMLQFCGQKFRIYRRAHKTCDTVFPVRGRKVADCVHLETRCDGQSHGGCQAGCLIFWKEAWLKPIDPNEMKDESLRQRNGSATVSFKLSAHDTGDAVREEGVVSNDDETNPTYVCQATQLPYATSSLSPWDIRQYIEDFTSGNASLAQMARGFIYMTVNRFINLGIGLGKPMRWCYDVFQRFFGGIPYPRRVGIIPIGSPTPSAKLDLSEGEWVRVKSYKEILATCDKSLRNRGMLFDAEMVPYCGGTYRVLKRVTRIINERTGKLQEMKTPCIILDSVVCHSRYSECRLFCPRSIYAYWREIRLERVENAPANSAKPISNISIA